MKFFLLLFISSICLKTISQIPSYVPTDGLIGFWGFNGNTLDQTGNNNNGTLNGATLSSDRFGVSNRCYHFDGVNDFIRVNYVYDYPNKTVNGWFLADETYKSGNSAYQILNIDAQSLSNGFCSAQIESGILYLSGGGEAMSYATPVDSSKWYMFTMVRNTSNVKYYLNGSYLGQAPSGNITSTTNDNPNLIIGVDRAQTVQFFKGKIDEIGIWDRELNANEISSLYEESLGIESELELKAIETYPNPTSHSITIKGEKNMNQSFSIFDQMGREVFKGKLNGISNEVDVSMLSKGIYTLKIEGNYKPAQIVKE
jgi:hypothetical protein